MALLRATRYDEGAELVLEVADELAGRGERRAAASLIADAAWASEMAGGSPSAFALAAAGTPLVDPNERDDVWARLTILDLRRRESIEPGRVGVPIDTPERREAARLLHADPRFRGSLAWAVWDTRADVLERGTDDMHALTFWAGCYRDALPMWQRSAAAAEARGLVSEAVNDWAGAARCAVALGFLDDAESMMEHAARARRAASTCGGRSRCSSSAPRTTSSTRATTATTTCGDWRRCSRRRTPTARSAGPRRCGSRPAPRTLALEGRTDEARTFLDGACEALPSVPAWIVSSNRVVGDAAEAMWVLGDGTHLDAIAEAVRTKLVGPDFRCPLVDPRLALARVRGIAGDVDGARQAFDAARTVCDEDGLDTMRAMVDHDEGLLLARAGDTEGARTLAKVAAERFADLEMGGWLVRAEELAAR